MSVLIITIGNSDIQYVNKKKNECYPFDKKKLKDIQEKLQRNNKITWLPYLNKETNKAQIRQINKPLNFSASKKVKITFPLFEKILIKINEDINYNKWNKLEKIFVLYTNRYELLKKNIELSKFIKGCIESEPWYFATLIQQKYVEIKNHYNLDFLDIEIIKIKDNNGEIDRRIIIEYFDKFIRNKLSKFSKMEEDNKILIACAGGIPDIKNVIEEVTTSYFPDNTIIYDQKQHTDNVVISTYHNYKKKAKDKYELEERISAYDFDSSWDIVKEKKEKLDILSKDDIAYKLIMLGHEWLSGDPITAKKLCDQIRNNRNISKCDKDILGKMKEMLNKKNVASRSIVRVIYLLKKQNYWGVATVLVTAVEHLALSFINYLYPDSIDYHPKYPKSKVFLINKISNLPEPQKDLYEKDYNTMLKDGWKTYEFIIKHIKNKYKTGDNGSYAESILNTFFEKTGKFSQLKTNIRNPFIHDGKSVDEKSIYDVLDFPFYRTNFQNADIDFSKDNIESNLFKNMIHILNNIPKVSYINWLPKISEMILKELRALSPIKNKKD
ncbi:MAG: hypothetical protein KAW92_07160 [Candidatus Cloacimonetes bacterium]|nr:hypothetical protein [Candidatus Cloacimonadota bacterium]